MICSNENSAIIYTPFYVPKHVMCFLFGYIIQFLVSCLLPEMEIHELGRKIWVCTWHCWRIRHLRQQYGSVSLPINGWIWVSLPKK